MPSTTTHLSDREMNAVAEQLKAISEISQVASSGHSIPDTLKVVLKALADIIQPDLVCIYLEEKGHLQPFKSYLTITEYPSDAWQIDKRHRLYKATHLSDTALLEYPDNQRNPSLQTEPALRGHTVVPLAHKGKLLGEIAMGSTTQSDFNEWEDFIEAVIVMTTSSLTNISKLNNTISKQAALEKSIHQAQETSTRIRSYLEAFQQRMDAIMSMAKIGGWEYIPGEDQVFWSTTMYDLFEQSSTFQPHAGSLLSFSKKTYRRTIEIAFRNCLNKATAFDEEIEIDLPSHKTIWVSVKGKATVIDGTITKITGTVQDIDLLNRTKENLQHQQWLMQAVVENIPHMIFVKEASDLRHIVINKAGSDLTGIKKEDFLGKNAFDLFPPEDAAMYAQKDREVFTNRNTLDIPQEPISTRNKGVRQLHTKKIPIFDENNSPIYLLGISEDITARIEYEGHLKKAKEEALLASEAKSQFLANMSHEIRTPMNGVLGYLELALEQNELSKSTRNYLYTAHSSAKSLLTIINDILDLTKIEAGKVHLEKSSFKLSKLLRKTINNLQVAAHKKDIETSLHLDKSLFTCVTGDKLRLRQVLTNIIGNAIKFTDQGKITVTVAPASAGFISFTVADTGIGLSETQLKRIFSPFVQADVSTTRRYGGTGLGTTISNQLVELMGGKLLAKSKGLGKGTTFSFSIPMQIPDCGPEGCHVDCDEFSKPDDLDDHPQTRRFNILLAEDLETNANLAKIRLKQRGHRVEHVWNGAEAIEAMRHHKFDVILMDIQMPVIDGIEATRKIRALENRNAGHIPIIALTASLMQKDRQSCLNAGMDAIVGKPLNLYELFSTLDKTVPPEYGEPMSSVPLHVKSYQDVRLPEKLPGINIQKALSNWGDSKAFLTELLKFRLRFGDAAEKIQLAVSNNDIKEAHSISHALKGVAGNLAIESIFNCSIPLNNILKKTVQEIESTSKEVSSLVFVLEEELTSVSAVLEKLATEHRLEAVTGCADPEKTRELLKELHSNLDEYNPGAVQSQLEALINLADKKKLDEIVVAVAGFDFDRAKILTSLLIQSLPEGD